MRTARVVVGKESSKGATMMMSKASAIAERSRKAQMDEKSKETPIDEFINMINEQEEDTAPQQCPVPITEVNSHLFIGDKIAAEDARILKNYRITHIINAAVEIPNFYEGKLPYVNLKLQDDPSQKLQPALEFAYKAIHDAMLQNPNARILVHCAAGKSRSAAVIIYYLMKNAKPNMPFDRAYGWLQALRPFVHLNPGFEAELESLSK